MTKISMPNWILKTITYIKEKCKTKIIPFCREHSKLIFGIIVAIIFLAYLIPAVLNDWFGSIFRSKLENANDKMISAWGDFWGGIGSILSLITIIILVVDKKKNEEEKRLEQERGEIKYLIEKVVVLPEEYNFIKEYGMIIRMNISDYVDDYRKSNIDQLNAIVSRFDLIKNHIENEKLNTSEKEIFRLALYMKFSIDERNLLRLNLKNIKTIEWLLGEKEEYKPLMNMVFDL